MLATQDHKEHPPDPDPGIEALGSIEASLAAPGPRPEDVERVLTALASALDPELGAPSPQKTLVFTQALDLVAGLKFEADGPALAACLLSIAKYAYMSGYPSKGLAASRRGVELFRRLETRPLLRKSLSIRGALLADTGDVSGSIEVFAEAIEVALELGDQVAELSTWNNLGVALLYATQYGDAIACFERTASIAEHDEKLNSHQGIAYGNIALACLHLEDYVRGLRAAKTAIELQGNPTNTLARLARVLIETHYTRLLLEVDSVEMARERCEIAKRIAAESGMERAELYAGMAEGLCEVHSGAVDVGLSRLSRLLQRARVLRGSLWDALMAMVGANEVAGRTDVALVYLRELMMHTRDIQQENALLHHRLHLEQLERRQQPSSSPELLIGRREAKLRDQLVQQVAHQELMKSRVEILERLAVSADLRTDASGEHSYRVGKLAALLARELGWDEGTVFLLELAARLHDIGKIGIPEQVLLKRGRLRDLEIEFAQSHAVIGADILAQSSVPHIKAAEEIARFHHEHWDGGGYPFGLAYGAIPVAARITALADVFDELTHAQVYEQKQSVQDALGEIAARRGGQFDPELTDLFLALVPQLQRQHSDLDAYLGQAARESRFIQARQKIASTLKQVHVGGRSAIS
jgi:putative two-component system response regulator